MPMIDGYDVDGEFREDVTWACYCTDCQVMLDAFERDTHNCETFCTICEEQSNKRDFTKYHAHCGADDSDDMDS